MNGFTQRRLERLRKSLLEINRKIKDMKDVKEPLLVSRDYHRKAIKKLCK